MKLLIVDATTESQARCAHRIEAFSPDDIETLELKVKLVGERDVMQRLEGAEVLVVGSGMGERGLTIARQAKSTYPNVDILMFVDDKSYGGGAFRSAYSVGVRKIFPESASHLDFLQELVAIQAQFRKDNKIREGKIVAVAHAKGGVGATSIAAALAEVCSMNGSKTLLWDLDVETRDLSRSLTVNGSEAKVVSSWVNGSMDITRQTLLDALIPISDEVMVLMPPDRMAESMDLVCHTDGMAICQRILELARNLFDVIIIDTGGRMGPSTGTILRAADTVLLVIDDTILGLTAVDLYLSFVKTLVGGMDRVVFLVNPYSGALLGVQQIAAELEPAHGLGEKPWRLPPVPHDPKAALWPGSGRTLFTMGQKNTRSVLTTVAKEIGIMEDTGTTLSGGFSGDVQPAGGGWISKVFGK